MFYNSRLSILLIEDNPGDIRLIQEAIKATPWDVELNVITDGEEAMEFLTQKHLNPYHKELQPDLIILDLNLPKKNGRTILKEIKNNPTLVHIPVSILTVSESEEDILQCYQLHANCYLNKPFKIEILNEKISQLLNFWFNTATRPIKKESNYAR